MMWWHYVAGYTFSLVMGRIMVGLVMREAWRQLGPIGGPTSLRGWLSPVIGEIEGVMFTTAWLLEKPEFILLWIAIKVTGQWKRWGEDNEVGGLIVPGRDIFNVFLLGSALSMIYAIVGGVMVKWLAQADWMPAIGVPLLIVIGTIILYFQAKQHYTKHGQSTTPRPTPNV
jgi:hypothetical protein